jgi:epoxyqueuosine reductase
VAELSTSGRAGAFRAWLEAGDHGSMGYLARTAEARLDPAGRFPWASRAVVCAFPCQDDAGEGEILPAVARYARGDDYHAVLKEKLRQLASHLEGLAGRPLHSHVFVDTSPLLERDLAERAGLGWIGKHTGLLTEDAGSWLLLGGFLTDLALPVSAPQPERCGACTACLTACPTGALTGAYRLDARRCIAYLTIEHRGWIPRELRPFLADWLYGCDLCQAACPWNEGRAAGLPELRARPALARLSLSELVALPACRYTVLFRGSAMKRATRAGLRRNAMILAGNRRDRSCRPALESALVDPDPVLRGTAGWALGRLGGAEEPLRRALARERDPEVREEFQCAVERVPSRA